MVNRFYLVSLNEEEEGKPIAADPSSVSIFPENLKVKEIEELQQPLMPHCHRERALLFHLSSVVTSPQ